MSFWCITTFFNPVGYQSLIDNYNIFKSSLLRQKANLLTLELAFGDDEFKLPQDGTVRIRGHSVMWHKERLINYAVSLLPEDCESYSWIDCDVLFSDDDWVYKARRKLERYDVMQLFKRVYYLPRGDKSYNNRATCMFDGVVNQRNNNDDWLVGRNNKSIPFAAPGFAWGARRNAINAGIYDRDIVGSGDCILVDCLLNSWPLHVANKFTREAEADIKNWMRYVKKLSVGFLPIDIFHLWHGNFLNRKYMGRHKTLLTHNYNPQVDIELKNNVFEWSSNKPEMHEDVKQYFYGRKEDS